MSASGEGATRRHDDRTVREAWSELTSNTLRKTVPQLLVAVFCWGTAFAGRGSISEIGPTAIVALVAGFAFYAIVIARVLGVLPPRFVKGLLFFLVLFFAYTLWLGLWLPVHRRDLREWLAWTAVMSGLVTALIVLPR